MTGPRPAVLRAADILWEASRSRSAVDPLTVTLPGQLSVEDAWSIQSLNRDRELATGRRVVGYKIGLSSEAMQRQMGVDQPDFGVLLDSMELHDGVLQLDRFLQPRVEAEIALRLRRDLGPGASQHDVLEATELAYPSIEVIDSRIKDWRLSLVDTVADNASSGAFAVGSAVPCDGLDLAGIGVRLRVNQQERACGLGSAALGHPARAAGWLAHRLADFGTVLTADSIILTGSLHASLPVGAGDVVEADFGSFGSVRLAVR